MIQPQYQTRVIKTNDGWMTFLIITLILLVSSFYTIYYLNMKLISVIDPIEDNIYKKDVTKIFEQKEEQQQKVTEEGYPEETKDFKTLLEEKRRTESLERTQSRPSSESLTMKNIETAGLKTSEETGVSAVIKDSFFVVNHVFTYDSTFKSEDAGESTFVKDVTIYLFVEMYNLQEDSNGEIDLGIDFKLKDGSDLTISGYDARDLVVFKGKPPYKDGYFLARMTIPLGDFEIGKYYTDLLIKDKVSDKTRAEKYVFRIKDPTLDN